MASNYTEHYGLCQWEATDQVLRTEFNEDNAKVEAALGSLEQTVKAHTEALAQCGNCKIVYGSYTGTGMYGSDNATRLEFEHKPLIVAIMPRSPNGALACLGFWAVRGCPFLFTDTQNNSSIGLSWEEHALSWQASNSYYQYNAGGTIYYYVALLTMEE